MAEEQMVYARKASGLVRGLSMTDAMLVGLMQCGITANYWAIVSIGLGVYLGGNLIVMALLTLVLAISIPFVWGMLAGSMPRAGGEYIYNSRILHPIVGIMESAGNLVAMLLWAYVLAPWVADPGLTTLGNLMGWERLVSFGSSSWGQFLTASIVNVLGFLSCAFGMKILSVTQRWIAVLAMGGGVVMLILFTVTSREAFRVKWDAVAAKYDSLPYDKFVAAAGNAAGTQIPTTWNWVSTMGLMGMGSWLVVYMFLTSYTAGEVKRPDKALLTANFTGIFISVGLFIWMAAGLYKMLPFDFLSATALTDLYGGIDGYTVPYLPSIMGLAYMAWPSWFVAFAVMGSFILICFWWVALTYMAFPRVLFAWGMDRMGPKWFTSINPRFASPLKSAVVCLVLIEAASFCYSFLWGDKMQGVLGTGVEILTTFGITGIAALVFAYRKRVRTIWNSSPYRTWKLAGIPVMTLGAAVYLVYLAIVFWALVLKEEMRDLSTTNIIIYCAIWTGGLAWYLSWRRVNKRHDINVDVAYKELPPE